MATTQRYSTSSARTTPGSTTYIPTSYSSRVSDPRGMILGAIKDSSFPGSSATGGRTSEKTGVTAKLRKTPRFSDGDTHINTSKGSSDDARSGGEKHSKESFWNRSRRMVQEFFTSLDSGTRTDRSNAVDRSSSHHRDLRPTVEDDTDIQPEETSGKGTQSSCDDNVSPQESVRSQDSYDAREPPRGRTNRRGAETHRPGYESTFERSTSRIRRLPLSSKKTKPPQPPFNPHDPTHFGSYDEWPSEKDLYMMSGANPDASHRRRYTTNDIRMSSQADTGTKRAKKRTRRRLEKQRRQRGTDRPTDIFGSMDHAYGGHPSSLYYHERPWSSKGTSYEHYEPPPHSPPWGHPSMRPSYGYSRPPPCTSMNPSMMSYGPPGSGWGGPPPAWDQNPSTQPGTCPQAPPHFTYVMSVLTNARKAIEGQRPPVMARPLYT
ncbi:hypothetical protein I302_100345 [Kwoniella bestiolae CBS 10118]|uniref:Uncharacterized protein n=1 Tax=Kwoniella bestiolae CBS 10118 TaxID=1296100 RepID=A0A1B9G4W7_9TREE|nr:hypothetical protein I302_03717 [Kwoniella bestiolae CBS 10118]OCF26040.1 hypothetical protein I302_03717 [Kwoniella bestiolae CBS 10118]